jgi:hypothetical protein
MEFRRIAPWVVALSVVVVLPGVASAQANKKDRVTFFCKHNGAIGLAADRFYEELRGTDKLYEWSGFYCTNNGYKKKAGQRPGIQAFCFECAQGENKVQLYAKNANEGTNRSVEIFPENVTVGSGTHFVVDDVRDIDAKMCRGVEAGVCVGPTTLRNNAGDISTVLESLNHTLRRDATPQPASGSTWQIIVENTASTSVQLVDLFAQVNNSGDPYDMATPYTPDGAVASLSPPFVATTLSPGQSVTYRFPGGDDARPIAITSLSVFQGDTLFTTLASIRANPILPGATPVGLVVLGGSLLALGYIGRTRWMIRRRA